MNIAAVIPARDIPMDVLDGTVDALHNSGYQYVLVSEENSRNASSVLCDQAVYGVSDKVWNRSRVINRGVRSLARNAFDAAIIVDAYCHPMPTARYESVKLWLSKGNTAVIGKLIREDGTVYSASMGMIAFMLSDYDATGGYDETYEGWGLEDIDFAIRMSKRCELHRAMEFRYLTHAKLMSDNERWNVWHAKNWNYWVGKGMNHTPVCVIEEL